MNSLAYIILFSFFMALIALIGSVGLLVPEKLLKKSILPLVAYAAGSLWGSAFFHLLPKSFHLLADKQDEAFIYLTAGFLMFFVLEHVIHWHHCHKTDHSHTHKPVGHLILVADGFHNFLSGLTIGAMFVVDIT